MHKRQIQILLGPKSRALHETKTQPAQLKTTYFPQTMLQIHYLLNF